MESFSQTIMAKNWVTISSLVQRNSEFDLKRDKKIN